MTCDNGMKWRTESLDLIILDLIAKRQGTLGDEELLEMLKAMLKEISMTELNKALIELELRGKINVSLLKKGRTITLMKARQRQGQA